MTPVTRLLSVGSIRAAGIALMGGLLPIVPAFASDDEVGATIYGQLNFGALQVDNGGGKERYFAENPSIPSRVGIRWRFALENAATLTIQLETGLGLTNLREVSPINDRLEFDFQRSDLRKFEVIYATKNWGALSVGQGNMASEPSAGSDLSRTGLAIGPSIGDLGGRTQFLAPDGTGTGVFVGDVFDDLAGLRKLRVRYDTPDWNGVTFTVAHGTEVLRRGRNLDFTDVALTYGVETEHVIVEAAASYEWIDSIEERAVASASVLHRQTGLNAAIASGTYQRGNGGYIYAKLGVTGDVSDHGPSALALEYYDGNDLGGIGLRSEAVGLGLTQNIHAWNLDLIAAMRRYRVRSPSQAFQKVDVFLIGARWRF